jgi:trehalose 2-sulfotransferase
MEMGPVPRMSCLIAATPRTGSWLLADALDRTGVAGHPDEYFRPEWRELWSRDWGLDPKCPYLKYVSAAVASGTTANGIFSVKLHWYQFEALARALLALRAAPARQTASAAVAAQFPDARYVHLCRRDTARQAISYYRAIHSGAWFLIDDDSPPDEPAEADFHQIRWLEELLTEHEDRWRRYFERSGITPLAVAYEDLAIDYENVVLGVLDWLGIGLADGACVPPARLTKQADERTEAWLSEYLRLRDVLPPRAPGTAMKAGAEPAATRGLCAAMILTDT